MTRNAAYQAASRLARKQRRVYVVVWSPEGEDAPGQHYHHATEETAETFFAGAPVHAYFGPDGTIEGEA